MYNYIYVRINMCIASYYLYTNMFVYIHDISFDIKQLSRPISPPRCPIDRHQGRSLPCWTKTWTWSPISRPLGEDIRRCRVRCLPAEICMIVVKNQPTMINCNWGINKDIYIYVYIYNTWINKVCNFQLSDYSIGKKYLHSQLKYSVCFIY
jgi:hypothetical protein